MEKAVLCERLSDTRTDESALYADAEKIVSELQAQGVDTRDFAPTSDNGKWRYPLPAGTKLFGESAQYVVISYGDADGGTFSGALYVGMADSSGIENLARKFGLKKPPRGDFSFSKDKDLVTRYLRFIYGEEKKKLDGADFGGSYVIALAAFLQHGDFVIGCQDLTGD